ncbi:hypothetical protein POVCU2_0020140 [Plasmodium ovale curtisi]|uniref:Uncharacterized protein n=1 Tax=Plasmodium ovale curtisi TaxID=864141 RepID=A0A1A8VS06_PLAOA|nr:hypothetical protein POVCU2_0020140 [Plasmodium ovale curtisi]
MLLLRHRFIGHVRGQRFSAAKFFTTKLHFCKQIGGFKPFSGKVCFMIRRTSFMKKKEGGKSLGIFRFPFSSNKSVLLEFVDMV